MILLALLLLSASPALAAPGAPAPAPATGVLTKPPELLQFVEATFPPTEVGHTGSVTLAVTLRADGTVEDAVVQESASPDFDAAAVAAVRQFVFSPAEIDGKPSRIKILYRYDFVEKLVAPTTAIFAGVVRNAETGAPLAGVTVSLPEGRTAVTDAEGRFELRDVPPGTLQVYLEGAELTALSTEETFTAGERLDATYDVTLASETMGEGDDFEMLITAPALARQAVSTEVGAEEARHVPGTSGDVLRVVENLPGVARASLGTGALVVWGSAPDDTGVYVDGVPVPRLYHDGGLRSVVGSEFVRSVELVPGGYGAAYGRGLGGLVSVKTRSFDDGVHSALSADIYDGAGFVGAPLGDHVNFGVAGRYGWVGPLLGAFYPDVRDYFPVPHYWDGQARLGFSLRQGETLDVTALASSDSTRKTAPNPDPARQASDEKTVRFQRLFVRYARDVGDGSTFSATLFGGFDSNALVSRFGPVETSVSSDVQLGGFRGAYRARVADWLTLESGLDAFVPTTDVVRTGSTALPAREGDVVAFGQPPPDQISSDAYTVVTYDAAPYVEADFAPFGDAWHLVPGLRVDPYGRSVSRAFPQVGSSPTNGLFLEDLRAEPRVSTRVAATERTWFTGALGVYGQQPQPADLSSAFGNPELPISTGVQRVLGGGSKPIDGLSIELTTFYVTTDALAMRSPLSQPSRARALLPVGAGRTYGAQSMIRLDPTHGLYGWLSYTYSRSERKDVSWADWRPSDYDQPHVFTALGGWQLPAGFDVAARARVASGFPRTEVVGAFYDDRRDLYEPLFGAHNATRLPTFFQADLRFAWSTVIGKSHLDVSLELQNVTDKQNVEEYYYNADYSTRGAIVGLPILPVPGLRWSL